MCMCVLLPFVLLATTIVPARASGSGDRELGPDTVRVRVRVRVRSMVIRVMVRIRVRIRVRVRVRIRVRRKASCLTMC